MNSWVSEFGDRFDGSTALVTGATGFIGRRLCEALCLLGADVVGLSRSAARTNLPAGVRPLALDLTDWQETRDRLSDDRYDAVFHLAGNVSARPDRDLVLPMLQSHVIGTASLLDAITERGCERFVLLGSSEEPRVSGDGAEAGSPYAAAKVAARQLALMYHRLYGLPVVALRLFLTYGPGQADTKLVPYAIRSLLDGRNTSLSSGSKICDGIYLDDAVRGLLMAATASDEALGGCFDLGAGAGITVRQLVERIAALVGASARLAFGEMPDRIGEESGSADLEQTTAILGWTPNWGTDAGLNHTIRHYNERLVVEAPR